MPILSFIFFFFLGHISLVAQSQGCIKGDCENGQGIFENFNQDTYKGRYEGTFQDGKPHGKGRFSFENGDLFEGFWKDGLPEGRGVMITKEGQVKQGIWKDGQMEMQARSSITVECLSGDCFQGNGRAKDISGNIYQGSFSNGQFHGFGQMRYVNGDTYQGLWKHGLRHGKGHLFYQNGHTDSGLFAQGRFIDNKMKIWALIVGVADYKYYSPLQFTTNDAQRVYSFFRSVEGGAVPDEQIKLLLDQNATAFQITNEAATLFEKADSNDLILFYFAGHGVNGGFLPYDYVPEQQNLLHHGVINSIFKDSPAKFKLCVADACHSGSFDIDQVVSYRDYMALYKESEEALTEATRSTKSIREKIKDYYKSFSGVKGGTAVILSSSAEEISLEANKLEQGVFSYFFIQALRGAANSLDQQVDNIINIGEMFDYINRNVKSFTYGFQHPAIYGNYDPKTPISIVHD